MFRQNKTHLPHKFIFPCLLIMLTILFPACSASSRANPTAESGSAYPAITSAEEGRNLIAERTNGRTIDSLGSEDLAFLRFCYDEIKTMEDFTEADYQAVERICSAQGDRRAQWEILYEAYCLYPTPDKAASLSDLAMPITTQESPLLARFNEQYFKISIFTFSEIFFSQSESFHTAASSSFNYHFCLIPFFFWRTERWVKEPMAGRETRFCRSVKAPRSEIYCIKQEMPSCSSSRARRAVSACPAY